MDWPKQSHVLKAKRHSHSLLSTGSSTSSTSSNLTVITSYFEVPDSLCVAGFCIGEAAAWCKMLRNICPARLSHLCTTSREASALAHSTTTAAPQAQSISRHRMSRLALNLSSGTDEGKVRSETQRMLDSGWNLEADSAGLD